MNKNKLVCELCSAELIAEEVSPEGWQWYSCPLFVGGTTEVSEHTSVLLDSNYIEHSGKKGD